MKVLQFAQYLFLLLLPLTTLAQKPEVYATKAGAIQGYDPVAYFEEGKPVKGKEELSYAWKGAKWHFASQKNLAAFKANPVKYAPQYGGYCAYAIANGSTVKIDPNVWAIVNGKLYLNYDASIGKKWKADQTNLIRKADANWPKALNKTDDHE
ncbi:MAG: YHS domain-containing protein [Bacteroidia bacterium]|nr:YHS domain-containing protein [Bacteroidia bacterium]